MRKWMFRCDHESNDTLVFGEGILTEVPRLIKRAVSEHELPPNRFRIHSLRAGGATRLYRAGVDLEYIRRFGR